MDLKQAMNKMKSAHDKPFFFFFCDQGADGKPVLLVDVKPIAQKEIAEVLATAKKKTKILGKMSINPAGELDVVPKGNAPSNLATGIQKASRDANAMVFRSINIGAAEKEEEEEQGGETADSPEVAALRAKIKAFEPAFRKAVESGGPQADTVKLLYEKMEEGLAEGKVPLAGQILEKLQAAVTNLLKGALAKQGSVPQTLPAPPPVPPPTGGRPPSTPPPGGGKPPEFVPAWAAAKIAWQAASDTVDSQITQLQRALRESADDELKQIGEFGLNALTGNFKVPLLAAIRGVDSAGGPALKAAADKLVAIIDGFQKHINSDEGVAACDDNPFGVTVTIKSSLKEAFDEMKQALATVT